MIFSLQLFESDTSVVKVASRYECLMFVQFQKINIQWYFNKIVALKHGLTFPVILMFYVYTHMLWKYLEEYECTIFHSNNQQGPSSRSWGPTRITWKCQKGQTIHFFVFCWRLDLRNIFCQKNFKRLKLKNSLSWISYTN